MMLDRSLSRWASSEDWNHTLARRSTSSRVIGLRAVPAQDEAVEGREFVGVEAQAPPTAGDRRRKVRARPVEHRHEVVADRVDPAGAEVAQRRAVVLEEPVEVALPDLDGLRDRKALDDAPAQPEAGRVLDEALALHDRLAGPDLAGRDVVQGGHDPRRPGLPDMRQADQVLGSPPPPGLFHLVPPCPGTGRDAARDLRERRETLRGPLVYQVPYVERYRLSRNRRERARVLPSPRTGLLPRDPRGGSAEHAVALLVDDLAAFRQGERGGIVLARMRLRPHEAMLLLARREILLDDTRRSGIAPSTDRAPGGSGSPCTPWPRPPAPPPARRRPRHRRKDVPTTL